MSISYAGGVWSASYIAAQDAGALSVTSIGVVSDEGVDLTLTTAPLVSTFTGAALNGVELDNTGDTFSWAGVNGFVVEEWPSVLSFVTLGLQSWPLSTVTLWASVASGAEVSTLGGMDTTASLTLLRAGPIGRDLAYYTTPVGGGAPSAVQPLVPFFFSSVYSPPAPPECTAALQVVTMTALSGCGVNAWYPPSLGGSLVFGATAGTYVSLPSTMFPNIGSGDFTVEWFQNMSSGTTAQFPRVFTMGFYPDAQLALSIEGIGTSRTAYVWLNSVNVMFAYYSSAGLYDAWQHVAVERSSGLLSLFIGGLAQATLVTDTDAIPGGDTFLIGNDSGFASDTTWEGELTNFRITTAAVYPMVGFLPPQSPLTALPSTILLLDAATAGTATTDSSALDSSVTAVGVTWSSDSPFM